MLIATMVLSGHMMKAQPEKDCILTLNALHHGALDFRLHGNQLVILRSDEHGRYQRDIIPLDAIEPASLNINPDADAVMVPCGVKQGACCESERFRDAITRKSSRVSIPIPLEDPSGIMTRACISDLALSIQNRLAETR